MSIKIPLSLLILFFCLVHIYCWDTLVKFSFWLYFSTSVFRIYIWWYSVQFSSVAQSCLTLWDSMDCSTQTSLSITNSLVILNNFCLFTDYLYDIMIIPSFTFKHFYCLFEHSYSCYFEFCVQSSCFHRQFLLLVLYLVYGLYFPVSYLWKADIFRYLFQLWYFCLLPFPRLVIYISYLVTG